MYARSVCKLELSDTIDGISARPHRINKSNDYSTSDRHLHAGLQRRSSVNKSDGAFLSFPIHPSSRRFLPKLSHRLSNKQYNGSVRNDFNEKDDLITRSESHDAETYEKVDLFVSDDCLSDKRQHYLDPSGSGLVDKVEERKMKEDNESVWVVQARENSPFAIRIDPELSRAGNPSPVRDVTMGVLSYPSF